MDATRHPRYLEVVLKRRQEAVNVEETIKRKREFLKSVSVQAWVDVLRTPSAYTMTYGVRPLRFDTSEEGVFAQFWESLRTAPGRDNILMFMHYLDYCALGSGRLFEEWLFYAAVLLCLHDAAADATTTDVKAWIAGRVAEKSCASFRPLPLLTLGFVPPSEPIPPADVHQIMHQVNVPAVLGFSPVAEPPNVVVKKGNGFS